MYIFHNEFHGYILVSRSAARFVWNISYLRRTNELLISVVSANECICPNGNIETVREQKSQYPRRVHVYVFCMFLTVYNNNARRCQCIYWNLLIVHYPN